MLAIKTVNMEQRVIHGYMNFNDDETFTLDTTQCALGNLSKYRFG